MTWINSKGRGDGINFYSGSLYGRIHFNCFRLCGGLQGRRVDQEGRMKGFIVILSVLGNGGIRPIVVFVQEWCNSRSVGRTSGGHEIK
jgi:hypothetical protein